MMRYEGMPDIPRQEHPEYDELKEIARENVRREVAALDVGLDLERHPEVLDRLSDIGNHFEDSVTIARIVENIHGRLTETMDLPNDRQWLMRAAVLHDIGKSGPPGEKTGFHDVVRRLFVTPIRPFNPFSANRPTTVAAFVEQQDMPDAEGILATLRENGIDPETEPAIEFWRRHAAWGYGILSESVAKDVAGDIDPDMVNVIGTHHLLEGKDPANLNAKNPNPEAHLLETLELAGLMAAADKYQAFRERAGLDHAETMSRLRKMFETSPAIGEAVRADFLKILDVLAKSEPELSKLFKKTA